MQRSTICIFFLIVLMGLGACLKPKQFATEPFIEFVSISRDSIASGDSILVTIYFEDGDGNLGYQENELLPFPCSPSATVDSNCLEHPTRDIFLVDERDNFIRDLNMPYLYQGTEKALSGEMDITLAQISYKPFCQAGLSDEVVYRLKIRDRSGNFSNEILLPPISVYCP